MLATKAGRHWYCGSLPRYCS
uniref:Uncharacterized protein n=1 Tax=Arundo donax TaxID=35708 RepID=A0A0A9GMF6_ARUDO